MEVGLSLTYVVSMRLGLGRQGLPREMNVGQKMIGGSVIFHAFTTIFSVRSIHIISDFKMKLYYTL
jgi:hypothetical protein